MIFRQAESQAESQAEDVRARKFNQREKLSMVTASRDEMSFLILEIAFPHYRFIARLGDV